MPEEHAYKRTKTDAELWALDVKTLYDMAADCDVEPADEDVCDACAAYMIGQEKSDLARIEAAKSARVSDEKLHILARFGDSDTMAMANELIERRSKDK